MRIYNTWRLHCPLLANAFLWLRDDSHRPLVTYSKETAKMIERESFHRLSRGLGDSHYNEPIYSLASS